MSPADLTIFTTAFVAELRERDAVLPSAHAANSVEAAHVASAVVDRIYLAQTMLEEVAKGDDEVALLAIRTLRRLKDML